MPDAMKKMTVGALVTAAVALSASGSIREMAMRPLPPGAIRPEGALRERLEAQAKGLTGHAEELYDDIGKSDWLTNAGRGGEFAWERGPYYARGLVALAFALDDAALKAKAKLWVDAVFSSQRETGDFGPRNDNWWANMLPLAFLSDWADATGDARVVPFMEQYFGYQEMRFGEFPLKAESKWAYARGGDELESVLWLYGKTGDARWLGFARQMAAMTADWTRYYRHGGDPAAHGYRSHVVNFMQGLKFPALKWLLTGDGEDRTAYAAAFDPQGWAMPQCGRPDAMLNGSEPLSDRSASAGTELCAIAERILSCRTVLAATGDAAAADDLEDVAYNSLAATVLPDGKGIRYYCILNQPMCVDKGLLFANNGFGSEVTGANCPGPHSGFGCCRSNWHVAWPKFVQSMWMMKEDGIAAVVHGPSSVAASLGVGKVTLREETEYPYSGKVRIVVVEGTGRFPLFVRVPRWAKAPDAGSFRRYEREWRPGDSVDIVFPMEVELSSWQNDAACVRRGPFVYALKMDAEWKKVETYKIPYEKCKVEDASGFPRWEIYPKSPWNYALLLDAATDGLQSVRVRSVREIEVAAVRSDYAGWGSMRADAPGRAVDPPTSPLPASECSSHAETVTLIPLADAQIRIALFPTCPSLTIRATD